MSAALALALVLAKAHAAYVAGGAVAHALYLRVLNALKAAKKRAEADVKAIEKSVGSLKV